VASRPTTTEAWPAGAPAGPHRAAPVVEAILGGGMPPSYYTVIHSSGSLSDAQKQALARGWRATLQRSPAIPGGG
jgi:hypothetical protein